MPLLSLPNEILLQIAQELTPKPLFRLLRACHFLGILLTPLLHSLADSPLLTLPNKVILHIARNLSLKALSRFLRTSPFHKRLLTSLLHDLVSSIRAESSLLWAAGRGHEPLVKILLKRGVGVNYRDPTTGATALHIATDNGHEGIVRVLLESKGLDINARDFKSRTALYFAAERGFDSLVALLLDHGIDADAVDASGDAALHIAARKTWSCETCKILLRRGVDLDIRNGDGKTAILVATNPETLQLLCKKGADMNAQDPKGMTALHHATSSGNVSMAKILLRNGANTEIRGGDYKKTALHMAALRGDGEIVQMLLNHGAMIDGKDINGVTPLSKAVIARSVEVVEILLEKGAGRYVEDDFGISPLRRALELSSNGEVVALMQRPHESGRSRSPETRRRLGKHKAGGNGELDKGGNVGRGRKPEGDENSRAQTSPVRSVVVQVARLLETPEKETNKATNTPS